LTQVKALSGEEALHLEQVCMAELQRIFVIASVFPEKEQPDFNTNKKAQAGACAGILEKSPRLGGEQFSVWIYCRSSYQCGGSVGSSEKSESHWRWA